MRAWWLMAQNGWRLRLASGSEGSVGLPAAAMRHSTFTDHGSGQGPMTPKRPKQHHINPHNFSMLRIINEFASSSLSCLTSCTHRSDIAVELSVKVASIYHLSAVVV